MHRGRHYAEVPGVAARHCAAVVTTVAACWLPCSLVRIEVVPGGGTLPVQAAELVDVHGMVARPQAKQEAGHKEAGRGLKDKEGAGHVARAWQHIDDGTF